MIKINGITVDVNQFPNGESYADFDESHLNVDANTVFMRFETDEDILFLQFVKDFIENKYPRSFVTLIMPYIPYSRMDRKEEKRFFTLKSFAKIVNNLGFDKVVVMEPHSEVSVALFDRIEVINKSSELALMAMRDSLGLMGSCWFQDKGYYDETDYNLQGLYERAENAGIYFVYPDAGAEKRYKKQIKYSKILTCAKERDFNTGNIKSIVVNGTEDAQDCKIAIIVDDLCSKGGTFVGSAKALRERIPNIEKVILCVTHCENTIYEGNVLKGTEVDKVYTTDSILKELYNAESTNFDRSKLHVEYVN